MNRTSLRIASGPMLAAAVLAFISVSPARAIVETIDGSATAEIKEFSGDELVNSDLSFEGLQESTGNLPLSAFAQIEDVVESYTAEGYGTAVFSDPRDSEGPNPREILLDLAVFSLGGEQRMSGRCAAEESRRITFTADELGIEQGAALTAESQFFLDGLVVIWGDLHADGRPTQVQTRMTVAQEREGLSPQTVFEATLTLASASDGTAVVTATGGLTSENVALVDASIQVPFLGSMYFVYIPEIGIPYEYPATTGEAFTLRATIETQADTRPNTGAAATFGLAPEELLSSLGNLLQIDLSELESEFDTLSNSPPESLKALPRMSGTRVTVTPESGISILPGFCGLLGAESLAGALVLLGLVTVHVRRR